MRRLARRWYRRKAFWALSIWSAFWVVWLIAEGGPVAPLAIAVIGFIGLSATLLGTRDQRRIEDWERRQREAQTLKAMRDEAMQSEEFEREAAELEKGQQP